MAVHFCSLLCVNNVFVFHVFGRFYRCGDIRWINLQFFALKRKLFSILFAISEIIPSMKNWPAFSFCFLFLFSFSFISQAQLRLPGISNSDVRQALEKVLIDFPKGFSTLKGEVLNNNPQSVEYASLLPFKSAEENTIIEYSGKEPVYSWQARMLTTEEFSVAEKKYKALYRDLKNISLTLNRDYSYGLSGKYDEPSERRKFATTVFQLTPSASSLPKVRVELSMQYEMMEWKVYLTVYQKEREDNERGKVEE